MRPCVAEFHLVPKSVKLHSQQFISQQISDIFIVIQTECGKMFCRKFVHLNFRSTAKQSHNLFIFRLKTLFSAEMNDFS